MDNLDIETLNINILNYINIFSNKFNFSIPNVNIINRQYEEGNHIQIDIIGQEFIENTIKYNHIHGLVNNIKRIIESTYNNSIFYKNIDDDGVQLDTINNKLTIYVDIYTNIYDQNYPLIDESNKITKEKLDQIYNSVESWDLPYKDRSFDQGKINQYILSLSDQNKDIAKNIINNTLYIPFDQFKEAMIKQVEKLPDQFNLYFDVTGTKIGSEHWLVMLLWPWLKDKIVNIVTNPEDIDGILPLVIIDDAMYSGQQSINLLDYIVNHFNFIDENIEYQLQPLTGQTRVKNKILNTNILLVIGYVNDAALVKLDQYAKELYNINNSQIYLYTDNIINNVFQYLTKYYIPETLVDFMGYMRAHFNIMDTNMALYFDHKIAGIYSSIPFYNEIVKELPSREKIELLKKSINI